MKSILSIINGMAWQYGVDNPGILEGGNYRPEQARVLRKMAKKWIRDHSVHSFYLYVKQKAKFLTKAGR